MTKYCAIFGVCTLLTYMLLSMIELALNIQLWPRDVTLGLIIAATALNLIGMYNDK